MQTERIHSSSFDIHVAHASSSVTVGGQVPFRKTNARSTYTSSPMSRHCVNNDSFSMTYTTESLVNRILRNNFPASSLITGPTTSNICRQQLKPVDIIKTKVHSLITGKNRKIQSIIVLNAVWGHINTNKCHTVTGCLEVEDSKREIMHTL